MSNYFWWLHIRKKYPENVRKVLNGKYKVIHIHEKKIKNIQKRCCNYRLFGIFPISWIIHPIDAERIKHHKYMIRKIKREIEGIKEYYGNY